MNDVVAVLIAFLGVMATGAAAFAAARTAKAAERSLTYAQTAAKASENLINEMRRDRNLAREALDVARESLDVAAHSLDVANEQLRWARLAPSVDAAGELIKSLAKISERILELPDTLSPGSVQVRTQPIHDARNAWMLHRGQYVGRLQEPALRADVHRFTDLLSHVMVGRQALLERVANGSVSGAQDRLRGLIQVLSAQLAAHVRGEDVTATALPAHEDHVDFWTLSSTEHSDRFGSSTN
ncbi:hypothetical protein [Euzebya pacifica]|uniref:hypothetical protein n=1 Tax=Euzebya pacifica TaxID=1608957 RepID=UPI0013DE8970|nr:hypothetical protein [Euzebya pacifica]